MINYRDVEKEKEVLALLLKSRRLNKTEILQKLSANTFSSEMTRKIFVIIRDHQYKYFAPINADILLTKVSESEEDSPTKKKLRRLVRRLRGMDVSAKMTDYLVEELNRCEHSRHIQQLLINAKDIFTQSGNPFMVREFLADGIAQARSTEQHEVEVLDLRGDWKERLKYIKKARLNPEFARGIESGIDSRFDDQTAGYNPGDLIIFVAQTSGGKSICMQDQAVFMAVELGRRVAFVTNEMTAKQTAFRMDSRISRVRHNKFKKPPTMRDIDLKKWKTSIKELRKNRLKIIGMHDGCSSAAIDSKLTEIAFKPDIIFIDYMQNMVPSSHTPRDSLSVDWQPQAIVVRETKNLALKRRIPIVSAGQLKPEAEGKEELEIRDIAISKQALSQNADCLFAIIQTKAMRLRNPPRAKIQFMKVREGKTREFIEVIPNFGLIRLNDPSMKRKKKKKRKKGED